MSSPAAEYHPSYPPKDGDLELFSIEGKRFRVHSFIIKLCSRYFKEELSKTRPLADGELVAVHMKDTAETIAAILDTIYPDREPADIRTVEAFHEVMNAAEVYEIPKVTSSLRFITLNISVTANNSLDMYALACRHAWSEQAKLASSNTLNINLGSSEYISTLERLDPEDLFNLQNLHLRRRRQLFALLDFNNRDKAVNWDSLTPKGSRLRLPKDGFAGVGWEMVRFQLCEALEMGELGTPEFWKSPKIASLVLGIYEKCGCYNCDCVEMTVRAWESEIQRLLTTLPTTI